MGRLDGKTALVAGAGRRGGARAGTVGEGCACPARGVLRRLDATIWDGSMGGTKTCQLTQGLAPLRREADTRARQWASEKSAVALSAAGNPTAASRFEGIPQDLDRNSSPLSTGKLLSNMQRIGAEAARWRGDTSRGSPRRGSADVAGRARSRWKPKPLIGITRPPSLATTLGTGATARMAPFQ